VDDGVVVAYTTAVVPDVVVAEPAVFEAVTAARSVEPTSAEPSV